MILTLLIEAESENDGVMVYAMPAAASFIETRITNADDEDSFDALADWLAKHGLPRNRDKCWTLGDGIFELKPGNVRLPFFWHPTMRRAIVVTHGFIKKRQETPPREIKQARRLRDAFDVAHKNGNITYVDEDEN